ncbi:MAG: SGNH/GDSL hydrolase family protein [Myxococcota bacterium]|nr:SGNH/GDSL hydrolase family protein [Myxococcota bacterium]
MSRAGIALRLAFLLGLAAVVAAIVVQERTLPLGLFNDGREAYRWASLACALAALAAGAVFAVELWRRVPSPLAGALRGGIVSLLLLELLLTGADRLLLSSPDSTLGGPYRQIDVPGHGPLPLKKPSPVSPFGFRWAEPEPVRTEAFRILFLGDSYVEGSGRSLACNYPEVAAATVSELLGRPVVALNAGVAGAGPVEALGTLRLLIDQGYRFDAVVHTLFLENDFTDDLPGTERRVVAGMSFRFPSAGWLRRLHPMNSTTARTALFVVRASRLSRRPPAAARRDPGACQLEPVPLESVPSELRQLALRRLEANYAPDSRLAEELVRDALRALRDEVALQGVPFVLATLPDRILVDADLRRALDVSLDDFDAERLQSFADAIAQREAIDAIDLRRALAAGSENYRPDDTHLSDLGNVRVGEALGRALARRFGQRPPTTSFPSSGSEALPSSTTR